MRWAVVLAGGVGSRFWPLSTAARPKQLLPLAGARPLIAESVARVLPLVPAERVFVVTSRALAPAVASAVPELPSGNVLAEPFAASTAPALARVPFVVLTASGQKAQLDRAHALGAAAFVTKPFSPNKLYQQACALVGERLGEED